MAPAWVVHGIIDLRIQCNTQNRALCHQASIYKDSCYVLSWFQTDKAFLRWSFQFGMMHDIFEALEKEKKMPEGMNGSQFSYRHTISWPSGGKCGALMLYNSPSWRFRTSKCCRTFQISLLPMRKPFALKVAFNWISTFGITQQWHYLYGD